MAKSKITKEEYYQVIGLLKLAEKKNQELKDIELALVDTLGAEESEHGDYYGHITDAVFGGEHDVRALLQRMNVEVED